MTTFVPTRDLTTPTTAIRPTRRLVSVGVVLAAASLSVIAFVQAVRPSTNDATTLVRDHSNGELWRMIGGGALAGGWAQWIWSVLVGLAIFALLQARIGRASAFGCVVATFRAGGGCRVGCPGSGPRRIPRLPRCRDFRSGGGGWRRGVVRSGAQGPVTHSAGLPFWRRGPGRARVTAAEPTGTR